jgi:hypothetical protein
MSRWGNDAYTSQTHGGGAFETALLHVGCAPHQVVEPREQL